MTTEEIRELYKGCNTPQEHMAAYKRHMSILKSEREEQKLGILLRKAERENRATMTQAERAARRSVGKARSRSQLPSDVLYGGLTFTEACAMTVPFTEERLKLEAETGVAHHIDHITPIAAGGLHTQSNLQVLTAKANTEKLLEDRVLVRQYKEEQSH